MEYLMYYLAAVNIALCVMMGADKLCAKMHKRRIPERTLFAAAIAGGALGGTVSDMGREKAIKALNDFLRPEFINRVDEIVYFNSLTEDDFKRIAALMLDETREAIAERGITLTWDDALVDYLVKKSYSATYGARNLRRTIQRDVEDAIAQKIIDCRGENAENIRVSSDGERVTVEVSA